MGSHVFTSATRIIAANSAAICAKSDVDHSKYDTSKMSRPHRFGFLLIDDFSLMSYASAVEPLRAANILAGRRLYEWSLLSTAAETVMSSSGLSAAAHFTVQNRARYDTILVFAGGNPASFSEAKTFAWLRKQAREGCAIGGVSGAPFILAKAGLLEGFRCTIHWEHVAAFAEAFPGIVTTGTLFEIDRGRLTCGGGVAALDMMHEIIRRDHGETLAARVSDWYLQTAVRVGDSAQRISLPERVGTHNRTVISAIAMMERQLADPLPRDVLANSAKVSVRQLERLFMHHLGMTIGTYYMSLRMARARTLLRQTSLLLLQIGAECGFSNSSHFAKVYRARFGISPSKDRALRRVGDRPKRRIQGAGTMRMRTNSSR
jgi:transcriptional regulator GlxA family with amidase domain